MIHISGSIAYDRIMTFPGKFEEHILPEKLSSINISFQVDSLVEKRGGTAGNIAYNLALLGEKSYTYSAVGNDFNSYGFAFNKLGIPLDFINVYEDNFTASCYITTDRAANQITAFSPAAMLNTLTEAQYPKANPEKDWAIVAPGNIVDMVNLSRHYAKNNIKTIFDPGQQIVVLPVEDLKECIGRCEILIGNDYEIAKMASSLNKTHEELAASVPYLITTLAKEGSKIEGAKFGKRVDIAPAKEVAIVDPTGCGDGYRAGLLKGLHSGIDIVQSAQLASVTASYCIEKNGTQEHTIEKNEFETRYRSVYNSYPDIPLFTNF